jgi:sigma-B regulation protein RsbU (phosphoserine phosphatase)
MNQSSVLVMALGVVNLLLVTAGSLLVYFDWDAARRREFLYLFFNDERPGANFFYAAKRRRVQFSRFLPAFALFLAQHILFSWAYAGVVGETSPGETRPVLDAASAYHSWLYFLEIAGLALLISGLLYPPTASRAARQDLWLIIFLSLWAIFALAVVAGVWSDFGQAASRWGADIARTMLVGAALATLWRAARRVAPKEEGAHRGGREGLLAIEPSTIGLALGLWWAGHVLGEVSNSPFAAPLCMVAALFPIVLTIGRGALGEYEVVEISRHRMGRERAVIFSFLKRIGNAFTSAVEIEGVLDIVLDSGLKTTEAMAGAIYLLNRNSKTLEPALVNSFFPPLYVDTPASLEGNRTEALEDEMKHQSFALGEGVIGEVAQTGEARLVRDVAAENIMLGTTTEYMRNRSMLVVPLRIRDEPLGVMAVLNKQRGSFTREDQALLQSLADQGALAIQYAMLTDEARSQERIARELKIARDIQQHLLPERCPEVPGFTIAGRATSATEVGGDYYDFVEIDDDHLGIVLADVSGKGVHAALIVAMIRSAFRTQARNTTDVRDVLSGVNEFIAQDLPQNMFITCVYGVLEFSTRTFSYGRAGHEPLLLAHPGAPAELHSPDGFALGVIGSPDFRDMLEIEVVQLAPGDRMLLFTDGLTEAMNAGGEEFGMQRILQIFDPSQIDIAARAARMAAGNGAIPSPPPTSSTVNSSADATAIIGAGRTSTGPRSNSLSGSSRDDQQFGRSEERCEDPGAPGLSVDEPEDLKSIERAVEAHVDGAPQSDDLTLVYVCADALPVPSSS